MSRSIALVGALAVTAFAGSAAAQVSPAVAVAPANTPAPYAMTAPPYGAPATAPPPYGAPATAPGTPPGYPVTVVETGPPSTPPPVVVERNDTDESKDSGLGLEWFWIDADIGGSYVGLASVNSSNFSLQRSSSAGPAFGLAAGVRLLFLTIGVRARDLQLADFNLWELNLDVAFHTRIDRIDPYFALRGGYAFVGRLSSSAIASIDGTSPDVGIRGGNGGLAIGCDYYFNHFVSLGLDLNPELIFLQRPRAALPSNFNSLPTQAQADIKASPLYQESGSSIGFGFTGTAHLGIHL